MRSHYRTTQPKRTLTKLREPFATICDRVNDRDRQFFRDHPGECSYLRPFTPGEHDPRTLKKLGVEPPGLDDWVLVWSVAPGVRCRQPVGRIVSKKPVSGRITLLFPDGSVVEDVLVAGGSSER